MQKSISVFDFSLDHTLNSAQFFSFEKKDNEYIIHNREKVFSIRQESNILFFENIEEKELEIFFNLNFNMKMLLENIEDDFLKEAIEKYWGLRVMKTELWQTIIAFICSANANTSKIKKNLRLISKFFGKEVIFRGEKFNLFPSPSEINNLALLKEAKTGYRAEFILKTSKLISENPLILDEIQTASYKRAKQLLQSLPGIGPKVADCICLFSLNHYEAFPIDTWVIKIIETIYLKRNAKNKKEIEEFIISYFKTARGIKQQYLFHHMRNLPKK